MQKTLGIETSSPLSQRSLCFYRICEMNASLHVTMFTPRSPTFGLSISHWHRNQTQTPIICARKRKRKIVSDRARKIMLNLMPIIASNLKVLPQPFNWFVGEIAGGDGSGGGSGYWKGFGWGGFDGWRRKRKRNLLLYGFFIICVLGFLFGRESNVVWCVLGFSPIGIALIQWWEQRGIQGWILGFCICSLLVGLGFRREEVQKWVGKCSLCSPMTETGRRRRRRGGRAF
ncbi:hypothetical protein FNV43_RR04893 [Rhamnella rubrinervis]|uniref:Transmembrane protein n=1 Tax=Rhamnella rubrinervis TaxID=2594499 RepID=A0A8K0MQ01_9ROSA|nr:hypothetical protein FNV43_RR04893 [Rhamnella rubrinervis]